MLTVTITMGLPASGKTTWTKEQIAKNPNGVKRINKDDLRAMLDDGKFSRDAEKFILKVRDSLILLALSEGRHVIVDDTNLAPKHITHIEQLVKGLATVEVREFECPLEECIKRDLKRSNPVGKDVIVGMYNQFLRPKAVFPHDPALGDVIICDLDGTLALLNGRDPYDASTCEDDLLNQPVADIVNDWATMIFSGRSDKYEKETRAFLKKHDIRFMGLVMRKEGDFRKDAIVKQEMLDTYIRGKYNVSFVLDDRQQVVDMWRDNGLTCFQVAEGNF